MKKKLLIPEQRTPHFYHPSQYVTWEQDLSHLKKNFSEKDLHHFLELYERAEKNPKKVKKEVEAFEKEHPNHPEVLNLLTYLYIACRKVRKANRLIKKNYEQNPDYFIGKINFGDLCLRQKKAQKIPEIFNKKFSLPEIFPDKKNFHISEFRGFMVLMGFYHLSIGKEEIARCYHYLAARVSPSHPSTKRLEKKLYYIPFYKRLILKYCKLNKNEL